MAASTIDLPVAIGNCITQHTEMADHADQTEHADQTDHNITIDVKKADTDAPDDDPFTWLSRWIMYFPLVVKSQLKNGNITKRNYPYSILFICIATFGTLGLGYSYTIPNFSDYGFGLYSIVYFVAMFLQTVAACISLYYFWKFFDFHILRTVNLSGGTLKANDYKKTTQRVTLRMQVLLGAVILCIITLIIIKVIKLLISADTETMDWIHLLRSIAYYLLSDVPLFLSQLVLSIHYCKGGIFISHLDQMIEADKEVDLVFVRAEYRTFRSQFKSSIELLEYVLKCRLCAVIFWIWIDLTEIVEADSVLDEIQNVIYLIMGAIPFIELVLAGSSATTKYHSFKKRIYAIQELTLELLYLLDYVAVYPFLVKIFAKEISIKNALKVTAAFALAKILTYLFKVRVN